MANGQLNLRTVKLGDNADTSKNFLIEVPTVADGSLSIKRGNGTDVLTVDNAGNIRAGVSCNLVGNGPAFRAYQNVAQTITNTPSKVLFQAENFDYGSAYDVATSRFQPTVAGVYKIDWTVGGAFSGNTYVQVHLYKNGALYSEGAIDSTAGVYRGIGGSDLVYLNGTTDYVEVFGSLTGASNLSTALSGSTHLSGFLARAA